MCTGRDFSPGQPFILANLISKTNGPRDAMLRTLECVDPLGVLLGRSFLSPPRNPFNCPSFGSVPFVRHATIGTVSSDMANRPVDLPAC